MKQEQDDLKRKEEQEKTKEQETEADEDEDDEDEEDEDRDEEEDEMKEDAEDDDEESVPKDELWGVTRDSFLSYFPGILWLLCILSLGFEDNLNLGGGVNVVKGGKWM